MKLYKWLYGAMALTMLGACSDNDLIPDNNQEPGGGSSNAVAGYMAVEIKLPQTSNGGTRAEDTGAMNDNFADGTANEYDVDNALIVLFKGKKSEGEKAAHFYRAQELKKPFFTNLPEDDNISASYIAAIEVKTQPGTDDNIWAMVILNRNEGTTNIGTTTPTNPEEEGEEYLKIGENTFNKSNTFADVLAAKTTNPLVKVETQANNVKKYSKFFMTNAPMSDQAGNMPLTDANIHYLTDLGNTIYDTPDEAKTNVSGCIYVERAVAKFTCQSFDQSKIDLTIIDEDGNEIDTSKWKISASVKYAVTNTPNESYVVRNVDFGTDDHFQWTFANRSRYRMVGLEPMPGLGTPFHGEEQPLYRTYWCKDPHYNSTLTNKNVVVKNDATPANNDPFTSIVNPLYAKENTFVVKNMNYRNTTIALFEVDFSITDENDKTMTDLYIKDGNTSKIYVTKEAAYADGITRIYNNLDIQNAVKECVVQGKTLPNDYNIKNALNITIAAEESDEDPGYEYLVVKSIALKKDNNYFNDASVTAFAQKIGNPEGTSTVKTQYNLLTNVNALSDVTVYSGGISYYAVPVKHFGDYYTPWDSDNIKGTTTSDVYNNGDDQWQDMDHARLYLGRYGVVRNNWYELNINKIAALGSPIVPDVNIDLSDDNNEDKKYFAVEIHILSWAKRVQNFQF
ncbi:MAG: Mfa1 fimbrilin C-terminal domain-containing protein [Muribaculaceae bacterium]|nr:Mfa1 fimbrilin C-terminal domain-containing protein [Muribaculaceae bacterium]